MFKPEILKYNNLTVVLDYIPDMYSVTLGLWTNIGSRVENETNNGICHFLEHMVFKGTKTRSSFNISEEIENKGGYINAYTSKEKTAWYAKVLKEETALGMDIIFDIVKNSIFPEEELKKEKGVIIEEIRMYNDSTQDIVHNLYDSLCYSGNSLSYPIIGNEKTINSFTRSTFIDHINKYYFPSNMIVIASGNFDKKVLLQSIESHVKDWVDKKINTEKVTPEFCSNKKVLVKKDIDQTNIIYGLNGYSYSSENYFKASILNYIMGDGMSSRLFIEIREKRGLAYFVHSFLNSYSDCGTWSVQVGCSANNVNIVLDIIREEMLKAKNITKKELEKAKNQIKSSLLISLENTTSRCERIAHNLINYGEIRDINNIIKKIDSITLDDTLDILNLISSSKETIAVVSNEDLKI